MSAGFQAVPLDAENAQIRGKGYSAAIHRICGLFANSIRLDQLAARRKPAPALRSDHLRRLAPSERFPQILVPDFEKCALKQNRYDAEADAPSV